MRPVSMRVCAGSEGALIEGGGVFNVSPLILSLSLWRAELNTLVAMASSPPLPLTRVSIGAITRGPGAVSSVPWKDERNSQLLRKDLSRWMKQEAVG